MSASGGQPLSRPQKAGHEPGVGQVDRGVERLLAHGLHVGERPLLVGGQVFHVDAGVAAAG